MKEMKDIVVNAIGEMADDSMCKSYAFVLDTKDNQYIMPKNFGFVYGFVIKIRNSKEKKELYNYLNKEDRCNQNSINKCKKWKPIKNDYYPLYWGRAVSAKSRLIQHIKGANGTNSIILNGLDMLKKYDIVFGAVFCGVDYDKVEKKMHKNYPDILKTIQPIVKR